MSEVSSRNKVECIKSIGYSDTEILTNIAKLHLDGQLWELDPCYSKGNFYKDIPEPKYKFDLNPSVDGVIRADVTAMPVKDKSINSIVFDPPFMFGTHGQTKNNRMNKRFTMFDSFEELESMYKGALQEFHRVLKTRGIVAFKCQDYTDSKTTMTHCLVHNWAEELGFYVKDLFILVFKGGRIYNPNLRQRHSRKFHSYYWVLQKRR